MQFRAAQGVQVSGMWPASRPPRSDREYPLHTARDRCLWHVGSTPARITISRLTATAPARPEGEARPGDHRPRWQALIEGAAAPCRLAVAECEAPVRLQRHVRRVVDIGPVPNAGHAALPEHLGLGEDGAELGPCRPPRAAQPAAPVSDHKALVRTCLTLRPGPLRDPESATKAALRALARRWHHLQAELDAPDVELTRLVSAAAPALLALPGIGLDTAGQLLVTAGDNPGRLGSEAAFARLCGWPAARLLGANRSSPAQPGW
jgi:hypothetical protein